MRSKRRMLGSLAMAMLALEFAPSALAQTDLLPDILTRKDDLFDHDIVMVGNERRLRLSNGTANVGDGLLYLYGGADLGDGTQQVMQRVFRDDGSWYDRVSGAFIYHPAHSHIHFEDWAEYRLREYLPGGGVGSIISVGRKVSFCIVDLAVYDSSLPNYNPVRQFASCSTTVQGLTVGWIDIYTKTLPDQYVDITGVPPGIYWLESVADPFDRVLEKDETNNTARIPIAIDIEGAADVYEPNDSAPEVATRIEGQANSPNLGPCNPQKVIASLTIDDGTDEDYFRFYFPGTGGPTDEVRIDFIHAEGDLEMRLLDSGRNELDYAQTTNDSETISMNGRSPDWYYVHVRGATGSVANGYILTIDPSSNAAPSIEVTDPPAGDIELISGVDTYEVHWNASDPDLDPTWVSFYVNSAPVLDGNELLDFASVNTPGNLGAATINSAGYPEGTFWVYCEVTDGGSTVGDWSEGTVTFAPPLDCIGDLDDDGDTDVLDFNLFATQFGDTVPPGTGADLDGNGVVDVFDFNLFAPDFGCDEL